MTVWQRLKPIRIRLLVLLAILGPGLITASADNDAPGIATYSMAGSRYVSPFARRGKLDYNINIESRRPYLESEDQAGVEVGE